MQKMKKMAVNKPMFVVGILLIIAAAAMFLFVEQDLGVSPIVFIEWMAKPRIPRCASFAIDAPTLKEHNTDIHSAICGINCSIANSIKICLVVFRISNKTSFTSGELADIH